MFCDFLNVWQQHDPGLGDFVSGRVVSVEGACSFRRHTGVDKSGVFVSGWLVADDDVVFDDDSVVDGIPSVDYAVGKFVMHTGSYETRLFIRMVAGRVEVRGNPSSLGRLDNVFGVSVDEGIELYNEVLCQLGLPVFTCGDFINTASHLVDGVATANSVIYTGAHITRCDMTANFSVGMGNVRHFNLWSAQQHLYRQPGEVEQFARWNFNTVMLSDSKYWLRVKVYDKSLALQERSLPEYIKKVRQSVRDRVVSSSVGDRLISEAESYIEALALWAAEVGLVRWECQFCSRWLVQHDDCRFWRPEVAAAFLREAAGIEMEKLLSRPVLVDQSVKSSLTAAEYRFLDRWERGENLRDVLSKPTFYRVRSSLLLKVGCDIAARPLVTIARSPEPVFFRVRVLSLSDAPAFYRPPPSLSERLAA